MPDEPVTPPPTWQEVLALSQEIQNRCKPYPTIVILLNPFDNAQHITTTIPPQAALLLLREAIATIQKQTPHLMKKAPPKRSN